MICVCLLVQRSPRVGRTPSRCQTPDMLLQGHWTCPCFGYIKVSHWSFLWMRKLDSERSGVMLKAVAVKVREAEHFPSRLCTGGRSSGATFHNPAVSLLTCSSFLHNFVRVFNGPRIATICFLVRCSDGRLSFSFVYGELGSQEF